MVEFLNKILIIFFSPKMKTQTIFFLSLNTNERFYDFFCFVASLTSLRAAIKVAWCASGMWHIIVQHSIACCISSKWTR